MYFLLFFGSSSSDSWPFVGWALLLWFSVLSNLRGLAVGSFGSF